MSISRKVIATCVDREYTPLKWDLLLKELKISNHGGSVECGLMEALRDDHYLAFHALLDCAEIHKLPFDAIRSQGPGKGSLLSECFAKGKVGLIVRILPNVFKHQPIATADDLLTGKFTVNGSRVIASWMMDHKASAQQLERFAKAMAPKNKKLFKALKTPLPEDSNGLSNVAKHLVTILEKAARRRLSGDFGIGDSFSKLAQYVNDHKESPGYEGFVTSLRQFVELILGADQEDSIAGLSRFPILVTDWQCLGGAKSRLNDAIFWISKSSVASQWVEYYADHIIVALSLEQKVATSNQIHLKTLIRFHIGVPILIAEKIDPSFTCPNRQLSDSTIFDIKYQFYSFIEHQMSDGIQELSRLIDSAHPNHPSAARLAAMKLISENVIFKLYREQVLFKSSEQCDPPDLFLERAAYDEDIQFHTPLLIRFMLDTVRNSALFIPRINDAFEPSMTALQFECDFIESLGKTLTLADIKNSSCIDNTPAFTYLVYRRLRGLSDAYSTYASVPHVLRALTAIERAGAKIQRDLGQHSLSFDPAEIQGNVTVVPNDTFAALVRYRFPVGFLLAAKPEHPALFPAELIEWIQHPDFFRVLKHCRDVIDFFPIGQPNVFTYSVTTERPDIQSRLMRMIEFDDLPSRYLTQTVTGGVPFPIWYGSTQQTYFFEWIIQRWEPGLLSRGLKNCLSTDILFGRTQQSFLDGAICHQNEALIAIIVGFANDLGFECPDFRQAFQKVPELSIETAWTLIQNQLSEGVIDTLLAPSLTIPNLLLQIAETDCDSAFFALLSQTTTTLMGRLIANPQHPIKDLYDSHFYSHALRAAVQSNASKMMDRLISVDLSSPDAFEKAVTAARPFNPPDDSQRLSALWMLRRHLDLVEICFEGSLLEPTA